MKKQGKHTKQNNTALKTTRIILKSITWIMGVIFILSILMLDSEKFYIPLISMIVSGSWLYFMAWANGWTY